jgi:hypothetical protein
MRLYDLQLNNAIYSIRFVQNSEGIFKDQKQITIDENLIIDKKTVLHNILAINIIKYYSTYLLLLLLILGIA